MKLEHVIYCGDNLAWMKKMPDEFVDLCYNDPPSD
jgi:DNA modification methylase